MLWQARQGFVTGRGALDAASTPVVFAITYGSEVEDNTSQTSYSLASVGIGSADPNRYVVVAVFMRSSNAIATPTVTVGGAAATKVVEMIAGAGPASYVGLFQVPTIVASGTTATVAISGFGSAAARAAAAGYSVVTATSALPSGGAVASLATNGTTSMTGSCTVPSNGRSIVAMCCGGNNVPSSMSAPASNITVDRDAVIGASTTEVFAAHDTADRSGATTYTILTNSSTNGGNVAAVVAAWAP